MNRPRSKAKRAITSVEIDDGATAALDSFCDNSGRKKRWVVGKMIEWFVSQDEATKSLILGEWSEEMQREMLEAMLRKMARDDPHASGSDSVNGAA